MIPDIDIWRSPNELDGQHLWLRILKAIDALQEVRPGETKQ